MRFFRGGQIAIGIFLGVCLVIAFEFITNFFGSTFEPSETLFATVLGAAIALSGTMLTILSGKELEDSRTKAAKDTHLLSILAKLIDLNDAVAKNNAHFLTNDESAKVSFGVGDNQRSFTKPLEGYRRPIEFTTEEKAILMLLGGPKVFNKISDMQGIADQFSFLLQRHKTAHYELFDAMKSQGVKRDGYVIQGGIHKDSIQLMAMMDLDGALWSLVEDAARVIDAFLHDYLSFVNEQTSLKLGYELKSISPSTENHRRAVY